MLTSIIRTLRTHLTHLTHPKTPKSALLPSILIYTLGAFGAVATGSTTVYLFEQSICRSHFSKIQPAAIGKGGLMDEGACKIPEVQARVAAVHGVYKVLMFMPPLILTGPYGRIAEVLGKRFVLFLNLISMTVGQLYFTGVCYFQLPIELLYITPFFDIVGGGSVIFSSFIYGFIAESVDPKDLSGILYKLSATQLIIAFLGMSLSSWLLRSHVWILCRLGIISLSFTIPCTLLFPNMARNPQSPHHPYSAPPFADETTVDADSALRISAGVVITSSIIKRDVSETTSLLSTSSSSSSATKFDSHFLSPSTTEKKSEESALSTIFHALTTQYMYSLTIFQDIYNSSPLSRITLLTYFLIMVGLEIQVFFIQWASVTFGWIIAEVNALSSFEMIVSGAVLLSLPWLSRRFLYPMLGKECSRVDIFIAKISISIQAIGLLGIGFAPNKIAYIASVTVWTAGVGWNDSLRSFVTTMLDATGNEDLDKLYLGIGMVESVAGMIGTAGWSAAYARVVGASWLAKRSLFVVGSTLILCSLGCTFVLGRFGRRRGRNVV